MKSSRIHLFTSLFIIVSILSLGACSSSGDTKVTADEVAETIYKRAKSNMRVGNFESAIEIFEKLESLFPFSKYALQGQLDLMYAYYKFNEGESAISQADRFIRFNPTHPKIDYVLYIKGIAQQNDRRGLFDKWAKPKREDYDTTPLKQAYNSFNQLLQQFPDSEYAADARQRMIFIRNTLADHEWQVADFYLNKFQYVAAANRAKEVIQNFPETAAARKALLTMQKAYEALEIHDLAANVKRVIDIN